VVNGFSTTECTEEDTEDTDKNQNTKIKSCFSDILAVGKVLSRGRLRKKRDPWKIDLGFCDFVEIVGENIQRNMRDYFCDLAVRETGFANGLKTLIAYFPSFVKYGLGKI